MSERYTKLFSLPENIYTEGSPVIVSAGNLLKDNQTGKIVVQLKIRNIAARTIKAVKLMILPKDITGKVLGESAEYEYLDLEAKQGDEFGQKTAITLSNSSTRAFAITVLQVVFTDNNIWRGNPSVEWSPLPSPKTLESELGDVELVKQFQIEYGSDCKVIPQRYLDIWQCKCGAWNRDASCYICRCDESIIELDIASLKQNLDKRLLEEAEQETARKQEEEKQKRVAQEKAKKTQRTLLIVGIVIVAAITALFVGTKILMPQKNINRPKF